MLTAVVSPVNSSVAVVNDPVFPPAINPDVPEAPAPATACRPVDILGLVDHAVPS
mgnify:CR=1 FL=1